MASELESNGENDPKGFKLIFRTLRYRNYRLFFGGQLISLIGTWMQTVALTWLVYRITNSVFLLGIVGFAGQLPALVFSPFAGVIADKLNKHRIVVITQILSMVQATILAILTLTRGIAVWHIIVLSVFLGLINAFDMPTRQSFLLEMIENKEDLGNAIAINSSMFNGARLIGPSIAGIIIAAIGEGLCFLLNAVSYIAVILALLAMKIPARSAIQPAEQGVMEGFAEGFRYISGFSPIRNILLLLALVSLLGMPYAVLMPVFARDVLHGGPNTLGFLMGATGVGALSGALMLASRRSVKGLAKWIPIAAAIFGVGLIGFSFSRSLLLSLILLLIAGFGMMVQMASSNTILQTVVEDDKRGRVMSFYTVSFIGMAPFGSLLAGSVATAIGAPYTVLGSGVVCILGGALFANQLPALQEKIRPIYVKLGISPVVSSGIQAASRLTGNPEE
ncbi:MAG TPA: MFS transporter [Bacteroidota bacterium]|nr:MFS transporter [Bacteroidota bacterium]